MKKLVLGLFLVGSFVFFSHAAPLVTIAPINGFGTPVAIQISSTTYTCVPSSSAVQLSGRLGVFVSNPGSNQIEGIYGNCTSNSVSTTIRPIHIQSSTTTTSGAYFSMREDVCLWLISLNPTNQWQQIFYQEIKQ